MKKEILVQYIDLQKELVEVRERIGKLEVQIDKIEQEGAVVDKVMGGDGGFQPFRIEGFPYPEYSRKKTLLYNRKAIAEGLEMEIAGMIHDVEIFISGIKDSHLRRIITLRVVDGLSWNQVAHRMGGGNTEDGVRKAFDRYLGKK